MLHITPLFAYIEAGCYFYNIMLVYNLVMLVVSYYPILTRVLFFFLFFLWFYFELTFLFSVFLCEGMLLFLQLLLQAWLAWLGLTSVQSFLLLLLNLLRFISPT